MYGVALLAGIGFTMSLFVSALAFGDPALVSSARLAILIGSALSAAAGLCVMRTFAGRTGQAYRRLSDSGV
jgi:NhaA family Na+:H+ antiporter